MKVCKCDICETIYPIPEIDTPYSITIEGQNYDDICDQCRNRLKRTLSEWKDFANTRAICKECGR